MAHFCHMSPEQVDRLKVRDFWLLVDAVDRQQAAIAKANEPGR